MAQPRLALALLAAGEFLGAPQELLGDLLEEIACGRPRAWIWQQVLGLYAAALVAAVRERARLTPGAVAIALFAALAASACLASANRVLQAWLSLYYVAGAVSLLATMASQAMGAADRRARRIGVSTLALLLAAGGTSAAAAEMRTFGQLFAHVAEGQFGTCASVKRATNPVHGRALERELTTKAQFVKALEDSFAFCDDVFASLTDESATQLVTIGQGEIVRSAIAVGILAHDSEMYGIATVYLRSKGLVPPSTLRQNGAKPQF